MKTITYNGVINRYRDRLPVSPSTEIITLNEGNTPLIYVKNFSESLGGNRKVYVKFEGLNPTCSFKDRGMTMAVTKAVEEGSRALICASTGNTSAAAAAYGARAGMTVFVLIPEGKIAAGKLAQAQMYGAVVIQIKGNFDDGLRMVKEVAEIAPVTIVNSVNPYRLQGQKTAAFEVIEQLGFVPDYHCLPVGNAGNITSYWLGYNEYFNDGVTEQKPIMLGYQAQGAAPFIKGAPVDDPETKATAIRIGHPQYWDGANNATKESGGWFQDFNDEDILKAQKLLAGGDGIFCEPASAASIAGVLHDVKQNKIREDSTIVCTLTGHGLKDPDIIQSQQLDAPMVIPAQLDAVKKIILSKLG